MKYATSEKIANAPATANEIVETVDHVFAASTWFVTEGLQ